MTVTTVNPLFMPREHEILTWIREANQLLSQEGGTAWQLLNFSGSKLSDIETRPHSDLTSIDAADDTDTDNTFDKHVSNAIMKASKDHRDSDAAHGSNGDIVGFLDLADTLTVGLVLKGATMNEVTLTAGATYTSNEQDMINDLKAQLNSLRTSLQAAGVIS